MPEPRESSDLNPILINTEMRLLKRTDLEDPEENPKRTFRSFFTPPRKVSLSFLAVILAGTVLLVLPISSRGDGIGGLNALFLATSATCVTGLSPIVMADELTLFGEIVMLLLIQIGGIGFITLMAVTLLKIRSRLSLKDKIAMREMLNWNNLADLKTVLRRILKYVFSFELAGAVLMLPVFAREEGFVRGCFDALFISVSAFCNAGFDPLGPSSLMPYHSSVVINLVVMALIFFGGIGFAVWMDITHLFRHLLKRFRNKEISHRFSHLLNTHTELVLSTNALLLLLSFFSILAFEYTNDGTIGAMNGGDEALASAFQSVTLRTAGYATVDMAAIRQPTAFLMILMMFIGGSPGGTAGGIKTTTFATLMLTAVSGIRGRQNVSVFKRVIPGDVIRRSLTIFCANAGVLMIGIGLLCITENAPFLNLAFEAASALATVGLTMGVTPALTAAGKVLIIFLMYIGRVGMVTLLISATSHKTGSSLAAHVNYPKGNIIVG